jgi:hypothetical protein
MQKLQTTALSELSGGKKVFTDNQRTLLGLACGAGIFVALFATGGVAFAAWATAAAIYGGGPACGLGLGDELFD